VIDATCPVHADFDPLSPEFLRDPYAVLAALDVEEAPVFYAPSLDYYVVTRHADVEQVFLDPATYSAGAAQLPLVQLVPEALKILAEGGHRPQPSMVSLDEPAHRRLRGPTSRAFTPRRTAAMEPRVRATVDALLDAVDPGAPFDLVPALTFPLPASMIFSFMGVPEADWAQLKEWCGHRAGLAWGRPTPEEQVVHARGMAAYRGYLRGLVASKAGDRGDDFASALLGIHDENPEALTHEEIASILFSLSFAGHETTNYLIGNLIRRLLEEPERWDAVVADPSLIPGAVEEILRYANPLHYFRRTAVSDTELSGTRIGAGEKVAMYYTSANRDEDVFDDPQRFDIHRHPNPHLSFGIGGHFCLGVHLARLEGKVFFEELLGTFPTIELTGAPVRTRSNLNNALKRLPVRLST
jgi:cytochrome P450